MLVAPLLATAAIANGCPAAAPVHHGWNRDAPATEAASWVAAGRGQQRLAGFLYTYEQTLGDRRVREASGLVVYARAPTKIAWVPRRWTGTGAFLVIAGRRLDGPGSFRQRFRRALAPHFFPSGIAFPAAGCWRLTLRSGSRRWTLHVRAIGRPVEPPCDATAVRRGANPVDSPFTTWVAATPGSANIFATFSISVPGVEGAAIYAGGKWPDGVTNTKVLWLVRDPSGPLDVAGTRLDRDGSFHQSVRAASSPSYAYPSIRTVPEAGCWLLKLRTSGRGAVIVIRALAP